MAAAELSLFQANWYEVYFCGVVEQAQEALQTIVSESLSKIPQRRVKLTNKDPMWKTPLIKDLERRRTQAFDKNDGNEVQRLTSVLNRETNTAKKAHVEKLKRGTKEWWKNVNKTLKPSCNNLFSFTTSFNSDEDAANSLNSNLVERFIETHPLQDQQTPTCSDQCIPTISLHDVLLGIRASRSGSASGPDGIRSWYIKKFQIYLVEPLSAIFNLSLKTGVFPSAWKHAMITPLPKVNRPTSYNDLRPISLTSVIAKIFEKIVLKLISTNWRSIMNIDQFAYRPLSSTTCALTAIQHH